MRTPRGQDPGTLGTGVSLAVGSLPLIGDFVPIALRCGSSTWIESMDERAIKLSI